jgi:hypothetical protein
MDFVNQIERFVSAVERMAAAQERMADQGERRTDAMLAEPPSPTEEEMAAAAALAATSAVPQHPVATTPPPVEPPAQTQPAAPVQTAPPTTPPPATGAEPDRKFTICQLAILGYELPAKTRTATLAEALDLLRAGNAKAVEKWAPFKRAVSAAPAQKTAPAAQPPAQTAPPATTPRCVACGDTGKNSKGGPCVCQTSTGSAPAVASATIEDARAALVLLRDAKIAGYTKAGKNADEAKAAAYADCTALISKHGKVAALKDIAEPSGPVFGAIVAAAKAALIGDF